MLIILKTLYNFFRALELILMIAILTTWLPLKPNHPLIHYIRMLVEPLLSPIRKLLKHSILGGRTSSFDFSPLILFIILEFLKALVA